MLVYEDDGDRMTVRDHNESPARVHFNINDVICRLDRKEVMALTGWLHEWLHDTAPDCHGE